MPTETPAPNSRHGLQLAELRAELVNARDKVKLLRAGVRAPTYDGPPAIDVFMHNRKELVRDESTGELTFRS